MGLIEEYQIIAYLIVQALDEREKNIREGELQEKASFIIFYAQLSLLE